MSASTDVRIKQQWVMDFLTDICSRGMISSRILPLETNPGFIITTQKTKGNPWNIVILVLRVSRNSKLVHQQKKSCSTSFGMQGARFTQNF
jgi:hypothetical protein